MIGANENMVTSIIMMIIAILLARGFYTGEYDWIMIYYGCAPDEDKKKVDRKKILLFPTTGFIVIAGIFFIKTLVYLLFPYSEIIQVVANILIVASLLGIIIPTFVICYKAYFKKKLKRG